MTNNNDTDRIIAQIACEAVINDGGWGFDIDTMNTVLQAGRDRGVGSLYIFGVEEVIDQTVTRGSDSRFI